jgi:hypothetical protein
MVMFARVPGFRFIATYKSPSRKPSKILKPWQVQGGLSVDQTWWAERGPYYCIYNILVGGLEHGFYFSIQLGILINNPN